MPNEYKLKYNNVETDIEDLIVNYSDGRLETRTFTGFKKSDETYYEWSYPNLTSDSWREEINITNKYKSESLETYFAKKGYNPNFHCVFSSFDDSVSNNTFKEFFGTIYIKPTYNENLEIQLRGKMRRNPSWGYAPSYQDYNEDLSIECLETPKRVIIILSGAGGPPSYNDGGGGSGAAGVYILRLDDMNSYWEITIPEGLHGDGASPSLSEAREQVKNLNTQLYLWKLESEEGGDDRWVRYNILDLGCGTHPYDHYKGGEGGLRTHYTAYNTFLNSYFWVLFEQDGNNGADEGWKYQSDKRAPGYYHSIIYSTNVISNQKPSTSYAPNSEQCDPENQNSGVGANSIFWWGGGSTAMSHQRGYAGAGGYSRSANNAYGYGGNGACQVFY